MLFFSFSAVRSLLQSIILSGSLSPYVDRIYIMTPSDTIFPAERYRMKKKIWKNLRGLVGHFIWVMCRWILVVSVALPCWKIWLYLYPGTVDSPCTSDWSWNSWRTFLAAVKDYSAIQLKLSQDQCFVDSWDVLHWEQLICSCSGSSVSSSNAAPCSRMSLKHLENSHGWAYPAFTHRDRALNGCS